ncbi:hypothetical protein A2415_04920 [candidate division WWE3 bacterium RIFOXYC1_FULL_39_7]|uniref:Uncharacterized protein n=2 Tax=Katanobacteria TaxID=422282 RepID=A0A1F4X8I6_UNCKA|nr:MAG: hypothetical protein A2415_04920 [candidate division WWE3 bacterium RIFOXYC1_FULL_39_7]OGC77403.1 MAG: hypothetical protein A2619_03250 [candidate division WWE3 bacterium RIFOXYD1_FULL_39_9]
MYIAFLAQALYEEFSSTLWPAGYSVAPVDTPVMYYRLETSLRGDSRGMPKMDEKHASVFEGLAFDPELIRCQTTVILFEEQIVATMSFVIYPKKWIAHEKYFERDGNEVVVRGYEYPTGSQPNFLIVPGWTKVDPAHTVSLAFAGYKCFMRVINLLIAKAPYNTHMEAVAKGTEIDKRRSLLELSQRNKGAVITAEEFGIPLENIAVPSEESAASVKMARILGLRQMPDIGSAVSLGPVFRTRIS